MDVEPAIAAWLLEGDPAIGWQARRDLLDRPQGEWSAERARVAHEGWGAALLAHQGADAQWSPDIYTPKWTSTFYTMQVLRLLGLPPADPRARAAATVMLDRGQRADGGLVYGSRAAANARSETCIAGMGLATAAYFVPDDSRITALVEYLLREQMDDGGWNCQRPNGATHASFHTTILVLEGLLEWESAAGPDSRVSSARGRGAEFLLGHRMFRSHRSGAVISPAFTQLSFPGRWHYDILRGLEYLAAANHERDARALDAIDILRAKRRKDGAWPVQHRHAGATYFEMEQAGKPSRWNTLRALRVLRWWEGPARPTA